MERRVRKFGEGNQDKGDEVERCLPRRSVKIAGKNGREGPFSVSSREMMRMPQLLVVSAP